MFPCDVTVTVLQSYRHSFNIVSIVTDALMGKRSCTPILFIKGPSKDYMGCFQNDDIDTTFVIILKEK